MKFINLSSRANKQGYMNYLYFKEYSKKLDLCIVMVLIYKKLLAKLNY